MWAGERIVKEPVWRYLTESRGEPRQRAAPVRAQRFQHQRARTATRSLPILRGNALPASAMVLIWTQFGVNHKNVNVKCKVRVMHRGDSAGSSSSAVSVSTSLPPQLYIYYACVSNWTDASHRASVAAGSFKQPVLRLLRVQPIVVVGSLSLGEI